MQSSFADIILPLALKGRLTYSIPEEMQEIVRRGTRVQVQLKDRKIYTGVVARVHNDVPDIKDIRPVMKAYGSDPVINDRQLDFWNWIAAYYMCTEGEVMKAAVPAALFPEGETNVPVVERYRPKKETFVELARRFSDMELNEILDSLRKAPRQSDILTAYLYLTGYTADSEIKALRKSYVLKKSGSAPSHINPLVKKGIFKQLSLEVGRLRYPENKTEQIRDLSNIQAVTYDSIRRIYKEKDIALLHGVTSSGKTEIYIHLIDEQLKKGKQVLYLLPEIALTTQLIIRLQKHFGNITGIYHSRFNDQERAEIWKKVAADDPGSGYRLVLGARSSIFLPFSNLGLVIVDEEHDISYKQHDPSPRYQARDCAIVLAGIHKAKTILGSATPSIESYYNAERGKYGFAELKERYGSIRLPSIILANSREAYRKKLMVSHFTPELLNSIDEALSKGEQIILFQNRRGFSPYIECSDCGWIPSCKQCAVNLTYHKSIGRLVCHYCGYSISVPHKCENCNSSGMVTRGFGTQKIEDEIKIVFPSARVERMDQDTTGSRNSFNRIIKAFEEHRTDILIGTQMISKGLDFENLTVVGILNADNLLHYPDFRAHERSFQLMEQVSGRAGRRQKQGKVVIQTSDPDNRIIRLMLQHDYQNMYRSQIEERRAFNYPPFCRMIRINLKHKSRADLNSFADILGNDLKGMFGKRVLGPEYPLISQIQSWYIKTLLIKIEKEKSLAKAREMIRAALDRLEKEKGAGGLRIGVDVDPY